MKDKKLTRYLRAVRRRLALPTEKKNRVMDDLRCSITERREAGQSDEEILSALGSARQTAAELNEQLSADTFRKSPWRFACLLAAIAAAVTLISQGLQLWFLNAQIHAIGVIGGADGPTSIFVTTSTEPWATAGTLIVALLILAAGIFGYIRLRRLPPKKS